MVRIRGVPGPELRRRARPVATGLATAAALMAVQLAVAAAADARPHFTLDLTLGTPVAADGETVTAVVRLTMADTRPGDRVTVAGRLTGGLRSVGADASRGTFDLPSGVWTVPTGPGTREAVLLWHFQATAGPPGSAETVRVAVTSPRTRAGLAPVPASPGGSPRSDGSDGSEPSGARAPKATPAPGSSAGSQGSPGSPVATGPTATASVSAATGGARPGAPNPTAAAPAPATPTSAKPETSKPTTSTPTTGTSPSPSPPKPPSAKPGSPTPSPTQPSRPSPSASPTPPPPPPPSPEVDVPPAQRCPDDPTSACAGLRFGTPALHLARTADATDARPGATLTHTVTVTDSGDAAALFANVRNSLPAGAPLLWGALSQGSYDVLTGVWQTGRIAAGGTATLTLAVRVPDQAVGTVMAARSDFVVSSDPAPTIAGACQDDPDSACTVTRIAARDLPGDVRSGRVGTVG